MRLTIAGGDLRMITAAKLFAESGYECSVFGFDKYNLNSNGIEYTEDIAETINKSAAVILPYPCRKNGFLNTPFSSRRIELESILSAGEHALFIGGSIPKIGGNILDYSENEDFLLRNAVFTAEGALKLAMDELDTALNGAEITIAGYGRIGSYLSKILHSLGAKVTVAARSGKSRTLAEISGVNAVGFEDFEAPLCRAQLVINTVPFKVIGAKQLAVIPKGTAIIDLASPPYGAAEKECEEYGIKLIRALGLPGKATPVSAGKAVFETVLPILTNRGITP